nr:hypothetical protein [Streptomyces sp. DSM 41633]
MALLYLCTVAVLAGFGRGDSTWRFLLAGAGARLASLAAVCAVVLWGTPTRARAGRGPTPP